ncbi:MAG: DinB family protein [Bacteroidetes bacterium]|nr:DinB family protein [Bacteroidota bacterium]
MKNHLLEQFSATFDKKQWFVSLRDAVQGLTDSEARQKLAADQHSIYDLVVHLIFWNDRYLHKLHGQTLPKVMSNEESFRTETDLHFDQLMVRADEVFSRWEVEIEKGLPADQDTDWVSILGNISLHNAYHIGQIVILRKLQHSWKKEFGVS